MKNNKKILFTIVSLNQETDEFINPEWSEMETLEEFKARMKREERERKIKKILDDKQDI